MTPKDKYTAYLVVVLDEITGKFLPNLTYYKAHPELSRSCSWLMIDADNFRNSLVDEICTLSGTGSVECYYCESKFLDTRQRNKHLEMCSRARSFALGTLILDYYEGHLTKRELLSQIKLLEKTRRLPRNRCKPSRKALRGMDLLDLPSSSIIRDVGSIWLLLKYNKGTY